MKEPMTDRTASFCRTALLSALLFSCSSGSGNDMSQGASGSGFAGDSASRGGSSAAGGASGGQSVGASGTAQGGTTSGAAGAAGNDAPGGGVGGAGASTGGAGASGGASEAGGASGGASGAHSGGQGGSGNGGFGGMAGAGGGSTFHICDGAAPAKAATIYTIGDSTMSVYASSLYPRMGWGQPLGDLFAMQCATIKDKALSGRSSKSFFDEGAWTPVRDALKSGDYVFIQFGHNDEKSDDPTLFTDPETTYKKYLTTYVNDTRAKQAVPILLTSINRNSWSGTTLQDTHGAYPPAVRELAVSLNVPLIDLTALTKTYFERIGRAETTKLFMDLAAGQFPNYPSGNTDDTHLQETGARKIGLLAMSNAYSQKLPVASFLKTVPIAP